MKDKRRPLLDLLLQTADDGAVLSHEDIREEISTFMFAVNHPCTFYQTMVSSFKLDSTRVMTLPLRR